MSNEDYITPIDLAEFVMRTAKLYEELGQKMRKIPEKMRKIPGVTYFAEAEFAAFAELARDLPNSRKYSINQETMNFVGRVSDELETEEVICLLSEITFPFDKMWIACPNFVGDKGLRTGFLILTDQSAHSFSFRYVIEGTDPLLPMVEKVKYKVNDTWLTFGPMSTTVSMEGITSDEVMPLHSMRECMGKLEKYGFTMPLYDRELKQKSTDEILNTATYLNYQMADFLARTFVVLGSKAILSSFYEPEKDAQIIREKNKARKRINRPPLLTSTTPIVVDFTSVDPRLDHENERDTKKQILFGKTNVKRSKFITRPDGTLWLRKRDGKPWYREEHVRGTRANADRTAAHREMRSTTPEASLINQPNRPIELIIGKENSDMPTP